MSSSRKKISIYDYPEHLNPFSEPTVPLRKTGKVFADRLNMSGTWSSKFTKRVNRSVTWIEKSWLGIDDSKKYKIQSAQTGHRDDSSKSTTVSESPPLTDSNATEKRDYDYEQVRERIRETVVNPHELISSAKCDEEKKEAKKKKKRPAPQPPNAAADSGSTTSPQNSHSASISSEKSQEVENSEADTPSVETHSVSGVSAVEKFSTSCESETADGRSFSESSANEPTSPRKAEHEDPSGQGEPESRLEECTTPTVSRPNRPSRSRDDEVKLVHSESESPKIAPEEQCSNNVLSADTEEGDDEVFVSSTNPQPNECELKEDAHVPASETKVEDCPVKIDNHNGAVVQV